MSILTNFFHLIKPEKGERYKISEFNSNMDIIDTEMHRPPLTINGISTDPVTRNTLVTQVPLADNLASDYAQFSDATFIERTSGGSASIKTGEAFLNVIKGNMIRTGYIAESITHEESDGLTVTIDRETFVSYVATSGTYNFAYTTSWSPSLSNYGITVSGTPTNGDSITVTYVKENPGTITTATPTSFNSTGWNLYDRTNGYARVVAYSEDYGYRIGGSYTQVQFATSPTDTNREPVTVANGLFNVEQDGFIFVTGGDNTTYIYPTWTTWVDGYQGNFQTYSVDSIDLSEIMVSFPNGLCKVGNTYDEINLNLKTAVVRIERMTNNAENMASVISSGVDYTYDSQYIYAVLETPTTITITTDGEYSANDHGIEFFEGTTIPCEVEVLYGENLKDKLRTDVLTISAQSLTTAQKSQVRSNIGAASADSLNALNTTVAGLSNSFMKYIRIRTQASKTVTVTIPNGSSFMIFCVRGASTQTGLIGVWAGYSGSTSNILELIAPSASTHSALSMNGTTLSIVTNSTSTLFFTIMYAASYEDK